MKKLTAISLALLSLPFFSRVWGKITRLKRPQFLTRRMIGWFHRKYKIDMSQYEGEINHYRCLVDFFTRRLNHAVRPLTVNENVLVSPADGILSGIETIYENRATQVKGRYYTITGLLKEDIDFSSGWHMATIYLSPANYHRFHYPLSGHIKRFFHTGGRLFPVNLLGLNHIDELFIRNERIITEIEKNDRVCYVVAVGATFVGSIRMDFIPDQMKKSRDKWETIHLDVRQLDEMGRFEMGSTIVVVVPAKMAEPIDQLVGKPVQVGQAIFKMI